MRTSDVPTAHADSEDKMDFSDFKSNIAVSRLLSALNFDEELEASHSYSDLKRRVQRVFGGDDDDGAWTDFKRRVDRYAGVWSSGAGGGLAAVL